MPEMETEASSLRLALVRSLAAHCPPQLGSEIAVTGSVARGVADQYSDVELNIWAETLPTITERQSWLETTGAGEISQIAEKEDAGGFHWMTCSFRGIWFEVGWTVIDRFERFVRDLAAGAFVGHAQLQMGWTMTHAVPLRTEGRLPDWTASLSHYPDGLAERVIADQTAVWSDPHVPGVRWALAARGERMGLALRFVWDMQHLLRVLFAVNHTWDRDLKWTDERSLDLPLQPAHLSARIDSLFTLAELQECVEIEQRLIIETLELARGQGFDVIAALQPVQDAFYKGRQIEQKARPARTLPRR